MKTQKLGWIAIIILSAMPVLLWAFEFPLAQRFSDLISATQSLGDIFGLAGMAMFAITLILSARLKVFEKFFNGMNEVYSAHHTLGALSFCFLLFHPLLLAYGYLMTSFQSASLFLLPSANNWAQNYGIIGLFLMIAPLLVTFYIKLKYHIWKFTHKFLGLAFIFAFFHTFTIGADIAINPYLKNYLFVLSAVALVAYFYRTLFGKYLVQKYEYLVKSIVRQLDGIWEIEFEPVGKAMKYLSGQFIFLKLYNKNLSQELHPFSISSGEGENLKIAIKELGDYTNKIGMVKVGDRAEIEGPYGKFNFRNFGEKQIWIAGGVGITPFLGMARVLNKIDSNFQVDLYYSVKDENCLAFKEELEKISGKNVKVFFWITKTDGFINAKAISEKTKDFKERDILVCGPPIMMSAIKKQFLDLNVEKNKVHTEEFNFY